MKQSIKYLIKKFIQDECTPDELEILKNYFQNNDIDQAFPEVEEVLEWLENHPKMDKKAVNEVYDKIIAKGTSSKRKSNPRKFLAWAALFIGIIGIGLFFTLPEEPQTEYSSFDFSNTIILETDDGKTQYITEEGQIKLTDKTGKVIGSKEDQVLVYSGQDDQSEEITYNTLTIPYGKRFQIKLADGSEVFLNAGSSLRYPVKFPKEGKREVFLTGEAYFDIEEDKNRPFIVETNEVKVNVLGTQFNVSSFSKEETTEVALVEGSVDLSASENNAVILKPGQLATYTKQEKKIDIKEVDTRLYTAWMKGEMVFRNETLDEILKRMERHFNVTILNKESKLSKERFNATFKEESADKILEYFNTIYGLKFTRKNNDTLIIQPDMIKTAEP